MSMVDRAKEDRIMVAAGVEVGRGGLRRGAS